MNKEYDSFDLGGLHCKSTINLSGGDLEDGSIFCPMYFGHTIWIVHYVQLISLAAHLLICRNFIDIVWDPKAPVESPPSTLSY